MNWLNAFMFLANLYSIILNTKGKTLYVANNKDPGKCDFKSRGKKVIVVDTKDNDRVLICIRSKGEFNWKPLDNAPFLGEYFHPADDCSEIVRKRTDADNGFYWVKPFGLQKATKVWCDVITDGGGFMLIGRKDNPVSWTLPSNAGVVSPYGKPHWSSMFGNVSMLEFRIQVSTTNNLKDSKADWLYRFKTPRRLEELLMSDQGGCTNHYPGVGYIEYVKDLLSKRLATQNFQCSRFGPPYIPNLGWKRMNQCLGQTCKQGFAMIPNIPNIQYDSFGSFSYSTNSERSGIIHNSTAFIGCELGKCCACFGPKRAFGDFCSPGCRSINGGTVTKKAQAWFWIRSSIPEQPIWKKCMEYIVKSHKGQLETHFIDPKTGVLKKGSCKKTGVANLIDGVVQVANRTDLDNIPLVKGLMSYREDNKKLYVTNGRSWEALGKQKQIDKQEKLINALKKQINKQGKENEELENILKNLRKNTTKITDALKSIFCPHGWVRLLSQCYYFSKQKTDWYSANSTCRGFGGNLVVPMNSKVESIIRSMVNQYGLHNPWIGLKRHQDGKFYTVYGTKPSYTNWGSGEPNNSGGNEDCGHFYFNFLKWNDIPCSYQYHFICEY